MKHLASILVSVLLGTIAHGASAAEGAVERASFMGLSVGLKGTFGGNYLTDPDDVPQHSPEVTLLYEDGAGGIGGGGGLYTELRILWGHLGLEFDVLFEGNKNWSSIEYGGAVDTDWITRFNTVRFPLLLEGSFEGKTTRVSLGVGPEFVVGTKAATDIEVTDDGGFAGVDDTVAQAEANFHAREQTTRSCASAWASRSRCG